MENNEVLANIDLEWLAFILIDGSCFSFIAVSESI